ncbi:hypothetical protein L3X37_13175 [Sabulilitoribacter arenilitoris]|uniref:Uncharacterized protein n=1 Tax=Wocania arenilitoris TaxID=2044858 RepID=A0AAE3JMG5_9FLAO|nr:hypothetical protein [Wocania arenilitoris]MCF7569302.1 hypothetical protein [Wocania arenilitoris]
MSIILSGNVYFDKLWNAALSIIMIIISLGLYSENAFRYWLYDTFRKICSN